MSLPKHFHRIERLARLPLQPVTISKMLEQHSLRECSDDACKTATWLRRELPIRLSHRIYDFMRLPHLVVCNPHIRKVYDAYNTSLELLLDCPEEIKSFEDENKFASVLKRQVQEHADVTKFLQQGHRDLSIIAKNDDNFNSFLDKLFLTRIGNRLLSQHYLSLREGNASLSGSGSSGSRSETDDEKIVGVVHKYCNPGEITRRTAKSLTRLCNEIYGVAPVIEIQDHDVTFAYIPDHLQFMMQELLKNALRATVERHRNLGSLDEGDAPLPSIVVDIHKGEFDVIIKISDRGGGMRRDTQKSMWQYGFTTSSVLRAAMEKKQEKSGMFNLNALSDAQKSKEMAGYGFGMPLALLYSRYFGGNLHLQTMHGFGSDVYLNLNHLGSTDELCLESHEFLSSPVNDLERRLDDHIQSRVIRPSFSLNSA